MIVVPMTKTVVKAGQQRFLTPQRRGATTIGLLFVYFLGYHNDESESCQPELGTGLVT